MKKNEDLLKGKESKISIMFSGNKKRSMGYEHMTSYLDRSIKSKKFEVLDIAWFLAKIDLLVLLPFLLVCVYFEMALTIIVTMALMLILAIIFSIWGIEITDYLNKKADENDKE